MSTTTHGIDRHESVQRKRKLAMVKCERCRLDKQKCLPIHRAWPNKCNRCVEKDFPCSEGQRVERNKKPKLDQEQEARGSPRDRADDENSRFHETLKKWSTLTSFHKMMDQAMQRFDSIRREMIKDFLDKWNTESDFAKAFNRSEGRRLLLFYEKLEKTLAHTTAEIFTSKVPKAYCASGLVAELVGHGTPILSWQTQCPICCDTGDDIRLHALADSGNSCGEYLLRQSRLDRHLGGKHCGDDASARLKKELFELSKQAPIVESMINTVLKDMNLLNSVPTTAKGNKSISNFMFRSDEICYQMWLHFWMEGDCLGRTGLHQYLDSISKYDEEDVKCLQTDYPNFYLDSQDLLGRSALHIACQRGWVDGVRVMLCQGANYWLKTIYGSTPLHYAAAVGSSSICRMLLAKAERFHGFSFQDTDCLGRTPLYYAINSHNIDLILLLFHPSLYHTQVASELSPLVQAISLGKEETVLVLLDLGAYSVAEDEAGVYEAQYKDLSNKSQIQELIEKARTFR
ncbi:ankyrin [Byssothecium circinans]|uniref:Ankyrin n=1 Tax=Byssothecium circinans TaxID=147558 RepID=A0A6A5UEB9_9PLEO|nr:ankyrin [Byssothecium circinans]